MVLLMLCLHLNSFAQHISMQLKNVTVKQAIETIQKQNGYSFYCCPLKLFEPKN